jgi:hypothetical protein
MMAKKKKHSFTALANHLFLLTTHASVIVKQPLMYFFAWAQKRNKEFGQIVAAATLSGEADLLFGLSPPALLVTEKCQEFSNQFAETLDMGNQCWAPVWQICRGIDGLRDGVATLINGATLVAAASWDLRIATVCKEMPFRLLDMLRSAFDIACETRRVVAQWLLDTRDCCLVKRDSDSTRSPSA